MAKLTARQHAALVWLRTHQPKLRSEAMVAMHPMTWVGLERRARIVENAVTFGVLVDTTFDAPESFGVSPPPAAIFVGGGVSQPGLMDACWDKLPAGGRLVVNAVTVESEAVLAQWFSRHGGKLSRFQNYRGEPVGSFTGWRPAMPVTQWSVLKPTDMT